MSTSEAWTTERLAAAIDELRERGGDRAEIEVKSAAGGVPSLGETLCAFGNMPEGGTILLGLDEHRGFAPVGLTDVAALEQGVAAQARDGVVPPVQCEFNTVTLNNEAVIVITVAPLPLQARPARHGGKAYLRQADGDYQMSEQEIAQVELQKTQATRPTRPDREAVPGTTVDDLDAGLLQQFLAAARAASRRYAAATDEEILRFTNVVRGSELTVAGLYALGKLPQSFSPSLSITAAVESPRGSGERLQDLVHLVGPIPDLLSDALAWVERNTRNGVGYGGRGQARNRPELPLRAVRELLANALVHRNLDPITDSKRVEVRLRPDRLVIVSPGGLWGVSEDRLGRPDAKSAVNPVLYDICKLTRTADGSRVIEGEGGGIREAMQAMREAGLPDPRFIDSGVQVVAMLEREGEASAPAEDSRTEPKRPGDKMPGEARMPSDLTGNQQKIYGALVEPRRFGDLVAVTGLTQAQVRYALQRLLEAGLVRMDGRQGMRGTRYVRR